MKNFCQNTKCYIKDEFFTARTQSVEHVIPNALGGHLKSKQLVCKEINTGLFANLDAELCNRIEISKLIKFKRDDSSKHPEIVGIGNSGLKYSVNNEKRAKLLSLKPIVFVDELGKELLKFPLHQKNQIISAILKKNPFLREKDIEIKIENEEKLEQLDYEHGLNIITSIDSFRAVAKIATNFYILNNGDRAFILDTINFIQEKEDYSKIKIGYFYPEEFLKYKLEDNEVSHILYLKSCKKDKLLYCYVELFNCHCFIIVLSNNYLGVEINQSYIWDLVNAKEINESVLMDISSDILSRPLDLYSDAVVKYYAGRLSRLSQTYNLKLREQDQYI